MNVSIHAPVRERQRAKKIRLTFSGFNSRSREGATNCLCVAPVPVSFNSRSREGATQMIAINIICTQSFNSRSREGATCPLYNFVQGQVFQFTLP